MRIILKAGLLLMLGASSALAQTPIPLSIAGKTARGSIDLPGGFRAELTIVFESVVGLSPAALQASARVVDPRDPALLARLPGAGLVTVPDAFPVLLRIGPTRSSALSFSGVTHISLYTQNLHLDPGMPMALYRAPDGGTFRDIALSEAAGSYRVCGSSGGFSEFLIVVDQQPIAAFILAKFDALGAVVTTNAPSMPPAVVASLRSQLADARRLFLTGSADAASDKVKAFDSYVKQRSGAEIPDVWRANDPLRVNVAGDLRSLAKTLRFSLKRHDH